MVPARLFRLTRLPRGSDHRTLDVIDAITLEAWPMDG